MKTCWASVLGDCNDKISREHLISKGLFIQDVVRVQGYSWCKNEPKEIGLSSLTSKILCTQHNNILSPVDTGGSEAFASLRELRRVATVRDAIRPRPWKVVRYKINGFLLERWFLKTLINISYGGNLPIGSPDAEQGKPLSELVHIAYGHKSFAKRAGLYSVVHVGQKINSVDSVAYTPLIKDNQYIGGGLFSFRGFRFMLFFNPEGPPERLTGIEFEGDDLSLSQMNYHNERIDSMCGKYLSQEVVFNWH